MRIVFLQNQSQPLDRPIQTEYADSFFSRFMGYMFRKPIAPYQGLLLVQGREDRIDSAIHMFFMNFDLGVIWLDAQLKVVDAQYARRWRPFYQPAGPARYVLETHPNHLKEFKIGQKIDLKDH